MAVRGLRRKPGIRRGTEERAVEIFSFLVIFFLSVIMLLPILHVVAKAFSAEWAIVTGRVGLWPVGFQWDAMKSIVNSRSFLTAFYNSIFTAAAGTLCTLTITAITAFPLSTRGLPAIKGVTLIFVFTMYFSGGIIPTYLLYHSYGLLNTRAVLIIPGLINIWHLLIIKNYYEGIPDSIIESARLDGANYFTVFFKLIAPLSVPVYAAIVVFTSVILWNNYFDPMMYINSARLQTLPLYLRDMIAKAQNTELKAILLEGAVAEEAMIAASIVASTIPILLVYPFMQRHFVKGVTMGSVKS
ncbi:MAG: carbohydrate ABC transporter permease [Treponema sp.]|jgi:putative aldouronate transport system permease protein|nr:carbohydrate ABC transporter permease [Treponema sp.]